VNALDGRFILGKPLLGAAFRGSSGAFESGVVFHAAAKVAVGARTANVVN
jgi:hypothetical protein